jgi:hypothetical protein
METNYLIYIAVFIIAIIADVLIGGWIGSTKGRRGMGQLLGLLTGPLGWLIVALLPPGSEDKTITIRSRHASRGIPCPLCSRLVPQGNTSCPQCGSSI